MSHYTKLILATSALTLVMMPAVADAKARRNVRAPAAESVASMQMREIEALKAQVQALSARLDAQETAHQQVATQAAAAEATAQETAVANQATQAQVTAQAEAIPDQVKMTLAKTPAKGGWWDDTKISGRIYYNISSISARSNGVKTETDGGYAIKRFYFGVDHKFNSIFSVNLTTDISLISGVGQTLFVKKAYGEAKLDPAFILRVGAADLPWIPYAESIYGYRHIEQTVSDRVRFGTSSDWGVHVMGSLLDGHVSYQASAVDGGGFRNPTFTKTIDVEGRVSAEYKGFNVAVGGYRGKLGKDTQANASLANPAVLNTATRFNALVAYKTKLFTVGGEYFQTRNWQVTTIDKEIGYSVFGSIAPIPKWSAFARYDWVKPNGITNPALKDHYYNIGVQYSPAKTVDFALVYKRDTADNGFISTGNGRIGGSIDGTFTELGLYGQFRF